MEFYKAGTENPWRISLLSFADGNLAIELSSPAADIEKVKLKILTRGDWDLMLDIMTRAINPDEIHQHIERGWENEL
jgi:hypothetical protein